MKNMEKITEQLTKKIAINWANPLLGLMTAHYFFTGAITHPAWWILIIPFVLAGNFNHTK